MSKKLSNENQYNNFASEFSDKDTVFPDITRDILYDEVNHLSLDGKFVLDAGCGYGKDLAYFAAKKAIVFGIDSSSEMITLAKESCPSAAYICDTIEQPFFTDKKFDLITSRYALQHAQNIGAVLNNMKAVLQKGGELVFFATHPFRQYFEKEKKDYWHQEVVTSHIFGKQLTVQEPSHTLDEYFNEDFLKGMSLKKMKEVFDPAAEAIPHYGKYPSVLLLHYKKED